ncbi:MAG: alpha/beta hydrolase [Rhodospirillaceae bacterium]|nr:alpha/beta hydrolase [Rhodospirillaceae bacterium]
MTYNNTTSEPSFAFSPADGSKIAYHLTPASLVEKSTGIVFLGGFRSDMNGTKAIALENWCKNEGRQFLRFDYTGHGQSSGRFEDGTISDWARDAIFAIENLSKGPVVLVGSSMGGWIMLLAALKVSSRIKGLLGLAAAPDFTQDMMERELSDAQISQMQKNGRIEIENCYDHGDPYIITKALIDDGKNNLVLQQSINISIPLRLIQGMKDADVPWQTALRIQEKITSDDVEIQFIKNGNHRLSEASDLNRMTATLDGLLKTIEETA